ncbi:hypothetical protein BV25DRAFT_1819445 [Artomyces pyxidatus]|uniref:Uncharacterized protein n=1 Tax=Artomyces pyxidatus TaxID=48021 RepID=A0ACB8TFI1_9AGAM|nr:hypothetical protein BV25DRAFT_1819445 [Artomyces pyxidatus]
MAFSTVLFAWLAIASTLCAVHGYIPAIATNDTNAAIASGLNITDTSRLYLQWYYLGYYSQPVSYQLVKSNSTGVSKGALVHFTEDVAGNESDITTTPWIALVSCDANSTHASQEFDIFTLASDRGAVGALLYSEWSQACIINAEYTDPTNFNQLMDIFSTQSLSSARVIESQFGVVNASVYGTYNATQLNASQADINSTLQAGYPTSAGYLWATLDAYNATDSANITGIPTSQGGGGQPVPSPGKKTTLAMVILYAITGCVAGLFSVVVLTGAIRAIRHPERYRAAGAGQGSNIGGQGRGGVLTRAILDTFPLVKFGGSAPQGGDTPEKDIEANSPAHEMKTLDVREGDDLTLTIPEIRGHSREVTADSEASVPSSSRSPTTMEQGLGREASDPLPAAIGRETCPICIVDFEEGDDVRVLPCEGHHVFHQTCVDPWLLELSSSCPICRHDFQALENMLSGETDYEQPGAHPSDAPAPRFSRYLRFARRRRRHPMDGPDPTDPPYPLAPGA